MKCGRPIIGQSAPPSRCGSRPYLRKNGPRHGKFARRSFPRRRREWLAIRGESSSTTFFASNAYGQHVAWSISSMSLAPVRKRLENLLHPVAPLEGDADTVRFFRLRSHPASLCVIFRSFYTCMVHWSTCSDWSFLLLLLPEVHA